LLIISDELAGLAFSFFLLINVWGPYLISLTKKTISYCFHWAVEFIAFDSVVHCILAFLFLDIIILATLVLV
jgi:hypothetical protein